MRPHLNCWEGDEVFVRAIVIEAASDVFKLRVEDYPRYCFTFFAPVSEVTRAEDIAQLGFPRRPDLKFRDPALNPEYLKVSRPLDPEN